MTSISCPRNSPIDTCKFLIREGHVRDAPEVGVKQCVTCGVVTHIKDLSSFVNYEVGSMWKYFSNSHDALSAPSEDVDRRKLAIERKFVNISRPSLIDIGCGSGDMMKALASSFQTFGVEPEKAMRDKNQEHGFKVWEDTNEVLRLGIKFDVVTLFHVIEHIYNPHEILRECYRLLKSGGRLFIETPNANDALLTIYKNIHFANFTYWSHHPILFTKSSLIDCVKSAGFEILDEKGVQRYSLRNHLYWLTKGKPGGHEFWSDFLSSKTLAAYEEDLIARDENDTLWIEAVRH